MQLQNKHKVMLGIVTALLIIRFGIVPIAKWQDEKIVNIKQSTQRLNKANNVIARLPQINIALTELQAVNEKSRRNFIEQPSMATFKLQQQQQIESLLKKFNITVKNFNWVTDISGKISQSRAKVNFEGQTADLIKLHLAIATLPAFIKVVQWTTYIKKKRKHRSLKNADDRNENSLGNASGHLVLIAYNISSAATILE
jgi:hypothetical protein